MTLKHVILGFLTDAPSTGYDLKKKFAESQVFHWSGNNNQIYKALVELHDEALVTVELQPQGSKPPRKVYTITDAGRSVLRHWLLSTAELPHYRNDLLIRLTWAGQLTPAEVDTMLEAYAEDVRLHIQMLHEQARRDRAASPPNDFKQQVADRWLGIYQQELAWVLALRQELSLRRSKP